MFQSRTVFIVGAGASAELGLPIGSGLKTKIAAALTIDRHRYELYTDKSIAQAINDYANTAVGLSHYSERTDLTTSADRIARNMPLAPSIDNFINSHRSDQHLVALSKIAIARCILQAERESALYCQNNGILSLPMNNPKFLSSWHIALWHHLNANVTNDEVDDIFLNVSFIVFNYDRCLEHFLYHCLKSYYNLTDQRAAAVLSKATIIHPYGQVGGLPFSKETVLASYGDDDPSNLFDISSQIKTFTESINKGFAADMRQVLRNAETLVTLGFGFIEQNLQLLTTTSSITRAFMTAYESSDTDTEVASDKIGGMIDRRPNTKGWRHRSADGFDAFIVKGSCSQLFADHRLRLTDRAQG